MHLLEGVIVCFSALMTSRTSAHGHLVLLFDPAVAQYSMAESCGQTVRSSLDGQEAKGKKEAAGTSVSLSRMS